MCEVSVDIGDMAKVIMGLLDSLTAHYTILDYTDGKERQISTPSDREHYETEAMYKEALKAWQKVRGETKFREEVHAGFMNAVIFQTIIKLAQSGVWLTLPSATEAWKSETHVNFS